MDEITSTTKEKKQNAVQNKKRKTKKDKEELEGSDELSPPIELTGDFAKLTMDIFLDILSRVPLESLSKCRWVCKSWHALIQYPSFAKLQYTMALQNNTAPCVLLFDKLNECYLIDHQVFDHSETWAQAHNLKFRELGFLNEVFEVVGSVNGLLCIFQRPELSSSLSYYICNPITREHLPIPKPPTNCKPAAVSGFGFDAATNEYKLIRIMQTLKSLKAKAEIFTLSMMSWRRISSVPYITDTTPSNVLVNGSLHWLTSENVNFLAIVSFTVGKEEFNVISPPSLEKKDAVNYLGVLGGCLCFVEADLSVFSDKNEIWVMKEYGVQGSWAKEYVFRREVMNDPWQGGCVIAQLRNGKFLLQYERKSLGYYDSGIETFKPVVIQNNRRLRENYVQAVIHVGSLFSPTNVGRLMKR